MAGSSASVVTNSLRLRGFRSNHRPVTPATTPATVSAAAELAAT